MSRSASASISSSRGSTKQGRTRPRWTVARTRPAVSTVLPPARARRFLGGVLGDELVEDRALLGPSPEDAPEALDVLADASRAREDDRDVRRRHVDALVQDARRDEERKRSRVETLEDVVPLLHARLMRDRGDEEAPRDAVHGGVVAREDQHAILAVRIEKALEHAKLGARCLRDLPLAAIGEERAAPFGRLRCRADEARPAAGRRKIDAAFAKEVEVGRSRIEIELALLLGEAD